MSVPRPDQSIYLAHFTKDGREFDPNHEIDNPTVQQMSAFDRLINILTERKIRATNMPWTNIKAVCFTECPWGSLLQHAKMYSSYGIGFKKKFIYNKKGNPVIYANPYMYNSENWDPKVKAFVTPFVPFYASDTIKNQRPFNGQFLDYTHEREWRVTRDLSFQYSNIQFIVLDNVNDLDRIPETIKNDIGLDKFLFMSMYRMIETLWPTHIID